MGQTPPGLRRAIPFIIFHNDQFGSCGYYGCAQAQRPSSGDLQWPMFKISRKDDGARLLSSSVLKRISFVKSAFSSVKIGGEKCLGITGSVNQRVHTIAQQNLRWL